jgi:hypothetical protein
MDLATEKLQKLKPNYSYKKGNEEEWVTITLSKVLDKF